jgi:hypothetical protein
MTLPKIAKVLMMPKYLLIAIIASIGMAAIYAYSQVLGVVENIDLWLKVMPWYNKILFSIFVTIFGASVAYQVYLWKQPKVCAINKVGRSASANSGATFGVFLVTQCPACASIGSLFLPLSAMLFIANFGWLINLIGIVVILFTINYLGGFKR